MTEIKLLNNVDHAALRVLPGHGVAFGDDLNQVPVFPAEFEEVQREYPILFRREPDEAWRAIALLGFDARENLFLDEQGWRARYIPAIQRRGPLSIGLRDSRPGGDPEPVIHVDLDHPRVSHSRGEPLFLQHGGNAPLLENMAEALRIIHEGVESTNSLASALDAAGVLEPVTLDVDVGGGRRYHVPNLLAVDRQRLGMLDAETLHRMNGQGFVALAVLAAASLGNVSRLATMKRDRSGSA